METVSGRYIHDDIDGRMDFEPHKKETLDIYKKKYIAVDDFLKWFETNFDLDYGKKGHGFFIKTNCKKIREEYNKLNADLMTEEEYEECIENLKAEYHEDLEFEVKKHIDTDKLYNQAIELWGKNAQIGLAIEECSELITKLAKYGRNVNGSTEKDILEEMVDVQIMLSQLKKIFSNPVKWEELYQKKLNRLKEYIEKDMEDVS